MIPADTNDAFPPDYPCPVPNLSAMIFQYRQPSPQLKVIPNFLFSYVHPAPAPVTPEPSGNGLMMHVHNHDVPQPIPGHRSGSWCSAEFRPTLQTCQGIRVPGTGARETSATAYEHVPWFPTTDPGASASVGPTPQPTSRTRVTTHPYTRVSFRKGTRPAADYTPDLQLVQARCVVDGGDPAAIGLLRGIFSEGISTKALTRRMTRDEAREYNRGAPGQMFRVFLRVDEEGRFRCRLCALDADEGGWKHARDALRHLKRDHFGLGTRCDRCGKVAYTTGELTKHRRVAPAGL